MTNVLFDSGSSADEPIIGAKYAFSNPLPFLDDNTLDSSTVTNDSSLLLAPASEKSIAYAACELITLFLTVI